MLLKKEVREHVLKQLGLCEEAIINEMNTELLKFNFESYTYDTPGSYCSAHLDFYLSYLKHLKDLNLFKEVVTKDV